MKRKIEAVLFTTGRFMSVPEIMKLCNFEDIILFENAMRELKGEYQKKDSAIELVEQNNKFKLTLKPEHFHISNKLAQGVELDKPIQETLAIIAQKNPVLQCEIIRLRNNKAYNHIKELSERDFITSEKKGRTRLLKLSKTFYDYFETTPNEVEEKLK